MNNKKKGQSLTEYLMTYGWAVLTLIVVAGVMWNMGFFGGGTEYMTEEEPILYESIEHYEYTLCIDRCIGNNLYLDSPDNCYKYHCRYYYHLWKQEPAYPTVEWNLSLLDNINNSIVSEATLYIIKINDTEQEGE